MTGERSTALHGSGAILIRCHRIPTRLRSGGRSHDFRAETQIGQLRFSASGRMVLHRLISHLSEAGFAGRPFQVIEDGRPIMRGTVRSFRNHWSVSEGRHLLRPFKGKPCNLKVEVQDLSQIAVSQLRGRCHSDVEAEKVPEAV